MESWINFTISIIEYSQQTMFCLVHLNMMLCSKRNQSNSKSSKAVEKACSPGRPTPFMYFYGVGARHRNAHVPAATAQPPPVTVSRQAQRSGGIAATVTQAPLAATADVQNDAAQLTQAVQATGPASAFGILEAMMTRMTT